MSEQPLTAALQDWPDGSAPGARLLDHPHIAIIGKMGSGKTTGADILVRDLKYQRASFAAVLKEVAILIWGEDAARDRRKLQDLGVAVRAIEVNSWVEALLRRISAWRGPIVIDDCRFPNEYWALKHMGFKFIRVRCSEAIREDRLMRNGKLQSREQFNHISETALDEIDADLGIWNERTESEFRVELLDLIARLDRGVL